MKRIFAWVECVNFCTELGRKGHRPACSEPHKLRVFELSLVRQYVPKRLSGDRSPVLPHSPTDKDRASSVEIVSFGAVDILSQDVTHRLFRHFRHMTGCTWTRLVWCPTSSLHK